MYYLNHSCINWSVFLLNYSGCTQNMIHLYLIITTTLGTSLVYLSFVIAMKMNYRYISSLQQIFRYNRDRYNRVQLNTNKNLYFLVASIQSFADYPNA